MFKLHFSCWIGRWWVWDENLGTWIGTSGDEFIWLEMVIQPCWCCLAITSVMDHTTTQCLYCIVLIRTCLTYVFSTLLIQNKPRFQHYHTNHVRWIMWTLSSAFCGRLCLLDRTCNDNHGAVFVYYWNGWRWWKKLQYNH